MISQFFSSLGWSSNKWSLLFANIFTGVLLIVLSHSSVFPLEDVNFFFFSFVGLLFALYRPAWAFLLLVGMLPYEIINIAPAGYEHFSLRPYQWLVVLIALSLSIRFVLKRFPVEKFIPNKWDWSILVFGISAFISASMSEHPSGALKLSLILFTFIALYFVTRIFVRSIEDLEMLLPFIFSSFFVISIWALIQNILFIHGGESFEVMSGRPNATFSEADWLGGYLATVLVLIATLLSFARTFFQENRVKVFRYILSILFFLGFVALIITVSRSAWLATFLGLFAVSLLFVWENKLWQKEKRQDTATVLHTLTTGLFVLMPLVGAFLIVYIFALSPFDLLDRSKSVASGEQEITIACDQDSILPLQLRKIESLDQLSLWHCRHIMLEEISSEQAAGRFIATVFRDDPNIHIRANIYTQVVEILKERPFLGIGFGNISPLLGTDERGTGLNASNIFLEIWLGSGIVGLSAFLFFWFGSLVRWFSRGIANASLVTLFLVPLWVTLTVFNLFNSGLMLGFFFFSLALFLVTDPHK